MCFSQTFKAQIMQSVMSHEVLVFGTCVLLRVGVHELTLIKIKVL